MGGLSAFLSYAHADDEHGGGQVGVFHRILEDELRVHAGEPFELFCDRVKLRPAQRWKDKIDASVGEAYLFVAVLSPSYLSSAQCQHELELFLDRERQLGRDDLVVPVYWVSDPRLEVDADAAADDPVRNLRARQWEDLRDLRRRVAEGREAIGDLAEWMVAVAREVAGRQQEATVRNDTPTTVTDGATAKDLPTSRSRRLGAELRRLREAAGLTQGEVGKALGCGITKISRIESGHRSVSPADLRRMLTTYGLTENGRRWRRLAALGRDADHPDWWDAYADVLPEGREFSTFLSLEDATDELRAYEPLVVYGLLQTADYARALIEANNLGDQSETTDRLVEVRMGRQAVLTRAERPVHLWVVVDEAALRRHVGGREVMRAQLAHLVDVTKLANVTIQVLPFTEGAYAGMMTPFTIVGFPEQADADVVLLENMSGNLFLERSFDLRRYNLAFDHMRARAESPAASVTMIENIRGEL